MNATIHDVARMANVSITTVSRVLNNNYPVKDETRERVEKVIKEIGYRPNEIARSLILKTTANIGVVVPGITNLFFPTIVEEINKTIAQEGYIISLFTTDGYSSVEKQVIDNIISRNMDGIIIIDPTVENLENGYLEQVGKITPTIVINGNTDKYSYNFVSYEETVGTEEAFEYLYGLGHRSFAFVRGDKSLSYDLKETVFRDFLKLRGLGRGIVLSVDNANSMHVLEETEKLFIKLFRSEFAATAIFACNDLMAVGILNACNKSNIRVPEDISIIGFDNTILSSISHPQITTIDLDIYEVARTAALKIMALIKNKALSTDKVVFRTRVVYRESCGSV